MRVLVNALASAGARTGIGHYTNELVRCLREQIGPAAVGVFPPPWLAAARQLWGRYRSHLNTSAPPAATDAGTSAPAVSWKARVMKTARSLGQELLTRSFQTACRRGGYDLYHEPNVVPLPCDLPTITTVHDLSVLLHPEWHPSDRVAHHEKHFAAGIARSKHILTVSEFARQEIIKTLGVPPSQVSRTWNGIRPNLRPLPKEEVRSRLHALGLPSNYLLFLGTLEPRKNVLMLLRAYCSLPARVREKYPLLLVGGKGWNSADIHDYLEQEASHKGAIHLGYVADEHLPALYNGARALLFPSFYEGFGLPPVEMMACGGAVLASTAGAIVELVGRKAHLLDPNDLDGWRQSLLRISTDDDWWKELRQGVEEVVRPFTWERCAIDTLAVYRQIVQGEPTVPQPAGGMI